LPLPIVFIVVLADTHATVPVHSTPSADQVFPGAMSTDAVRISFVSPHTQIEEARPRPLAFGNLSTGGGPNPQVTEETG